jgi:hypothetical protein
MLSLSEAKILSAKSRERAYKLYDERGLFLLVTPSGGRLWRLRYRIGNLDKLISLSGSFGLRDADRVAPLTSTALEPEGLYVAPQPGGGIIRSSVARRYQLTLVTPAGVVTAQLRTSRSRVSQNGRVLRSWGLSMAC